MTLYIYIYVGKLEDRQAGHGRGQGRAGQGRAGQGRVG